MTICIAALCDKGKSAVVVADRMAVFGSGSLLEFKLDDHASKIHELTTHAVLLHSGRTTDAELILADTKVYENCENLVETVDRTVLSLIEKKRDSEVARRLGSSFKYETLVNTVGNTSSGPLYEVLQQVRITDLGEMLIVSMKDGQYEIQAYYPPVSPVRSDLHYAAVGSGGIYARAALTIQQYTSNAKVSEALFQVYSAKKAAEIVYGVGEPTEMAVLTADGIRKASNETLKLLEKFRQEKSKFMVTEEQSISLKNSIGGLD